jgi:hypothetical protein
MDHAGSARNKKPSIRHASTLIHKFQSRQARQAPSIYNDAADRFAFVH